MTERQLVIKGEALDRLLRALALNHGDGDFAAGRIVWAEAEVQGLCESNDRSKPYYGGP